MAPRKLKIMWFTLYFNWAELRCVLQCLSQWYGNKNNILQWVVVATRNDNCKVVSKVLDRSLGRAHSRELLFCGHNFHLYFLWLIKYNLKLFCGIFIQSILLKCRKARKIFDNIQDQCGKDPGNLPNELISSFPPHRFLL